MLFRGFSNTIRLVHDREIQLFDGTRLLRHDKYDDMLANEYTVDQLTAEGIYRIHPSFRLVALAEPPIRKYLFEISISLSM